MDQEKKAESGQEIIKRRIETLAAAGYTQNWTSGIAIMSEVIDACCLVACDMVEDANLAIEEPDVYWQYVGMYTQMLFSRMQVMAPPPRQDGTRLLRGVPLPHFDPGQN